MRLFRGGSGARVVFLHGANGVPPWNSFFEQLASRYEVLMPEHPGFSTDKHAASIRSIADLAMYYLDFLDGFEGPVHLIGFSLGGWAAAELAVRNCSRLSTLTLIDPAGLRVKGVPMGDNFIWSVEELQRNLYFDQRIAEEILARHISEEDADRILTNRFMAARLGWEPRWFSPGLERWLHRITVPSLLIWGEEDKFLPAAYAKAWQKRVAGMRVALIPECGHIPHVEKPEATAAHILDFLKGR